MTAIAASDVTITVNARRIEGKKRKSDVTIAFGNGTLTYPSGGVPMPTYPSFGLVRNLDFLALHDPGNANGLVYKYDRTNNKLRIYEQGMRTGSTGAANDSESGALAEGGVDGVTETVVRLMDSAVNTTYQLGALKELTATSTPAAATLKAEAVGW